MTKDILLDQLSKMDFYCNALGSQGKKKTEAIRSILIRHFSISEQERKEAREWIDGVLHDEPGMNMMDIPRPIKTILRALGEK